VFVISNIYTETPSSQRYGVSTVTLSCMVMKFPLAEKNVLISAKKVNQNGY